MTALRPYADVWRLPGARTLLVASILGRLPIGMTPLALVLLVRGTTGSYAAAGATAAVYGVAQSLAGPLLGRAADSVGPSTVLLWTGCAQPLAVLALLGSVWAGLPAVVVGACAAVLGAVFPPLTAAVRSVWMDLTGGGRLQTPALALETTAFEIVFVLGPLLVGGIVAVASPAAVLGVTAVLTFAGTTSVALGRATRAWRPHPHRTRVRGFGPAVAPGMPLALAVAFAITFSFGVVGVAVPAFAIARSGTHHGDSVAGILLGLWGVGSVVGGVWFGTRHFRAPLPTQWALTLTAVAVGTAGFVFAPTVEVLGAVMLVAGLSLAPALIVENTVIARIAPAGMVNEAYTWVATIASGGSAAGAAVAGVVLDSRGGTTAAFLLGAVVVGLGALAAALPGNPLRRHAALTAPAARAVPADRPSRPGADDHGLPATTHPGRPAGSP